MSTDTTETPNTGELFAAHAEKTNQILEQLVTQQREAAKPKAEEKAQETVYTQDQLQSWVDEGKITVSQMVNYLVEQGTKKVAEELRREYRETLDSERKRGSVEQRISAYKAAIPELTDQRSDEFKRVKTAFDELVSDGEDAESLKTELLALRIAFPDGAKPKAATPRERTAERQRSVESAGSSSGRASGDKKNATGPWPSWFEDRRIKHYEDMIEKGLYKGHDDPILKKELEILERKRKGKAA